MRCFASSTHLHLLYCIASIPHVMHHTFSKDCLNLRLALHVEINRDVNLWHAPVSKPLRLVAGVMKPVLLQSQIRD